jgi:hypothetical protein
VELDGVDENLNSLLIRHGNDPVKNHVDVASRRNVILLRPVTIQARDLAALLWTDFMTSPHGVNCRSNLAIDTFDMFDGVTGFIPLLIKFMGRGPLIRGDLLNVGLVLHGHDCLRCRYAGTRTTQNRTPR